LARVSYPPVVMVDEVVLSVRHTLRPKKQLSIDNFLLDAS
jgi:hypothetical protein